MTAKQGHIYKWYGTEVMSMESGEVVVVAELDRAKEWPLGNEFIAYAQDLKPLPMRYFQGDVA